MNKNTKKEIEEITFNNYFNRDVLSFALHGAGYKSADHNYNKFRGELSISGITYDEETFEPEEEVAVGELRFHAYDLKNLGFSTRHEKFSFANANSYLFEAMDMDNGDNDLYYDVFKMDFQNLMKSMDENDRENINFVEHPYLIVLDRMFIYQEYRKQGIANFILNNFFKIFYAYYNITPVFVVGACVPDEGEAEDMKEIQKAMLEKCDFHVFSLKTETVFCKCVYDVKFVSEITE